MDQNREEIALRNIPYTIHEKVRIFVVRFTQKKSIDWLAGKKKRRSNAIYQKSYNIKRFTAFNGDEF